MSASPPNPPPELPQDSAATPDNGQERPLTSEELEALIDFFMLLNTWDRNKKIA